MLERLIKALKALGWVVFYLFSGLLWALLSIVFIPPHIHPAVGVVYVLAFAAGLAFAGMVHFVINGEGLFHPFDT